MIIAMLLISVSLVILNVRYALQYLFINQRETHSENQIPTVSLIIMLAVSDFVPIICMIACIKVAINGEWDCLLANFLHPPHKDDVSTECGSHMLDQFKQELHFESLLASEAFPEGSELNLHVRESIPIEFEDDLKSTSVYVDYHILN